MTFFNTLYFLNDEILSFSFFVLARPPQLPILLTTGLLRKFQAFLHYPSLVTLYKAFILFMT